MNRRIDTKSSTDQWHLPDPELWVEKFGDILYRYALSRLRRPQEAEEVVQEVLLAAWKSREQFAGRSQPHTWLLGIMKHKLLNRLRTRTRQGPWEPSESLDSWFTSWGKWRRPLGYWSDPAETIEQEDFWRVVRRCLSRLPGKMSAAFTLRTLDERDPQAVCRDLGISAANLWVLLHRARLRLVTCLQSNWFDEEEKGVLR